MIKVYCYSRCTTCKKALKWLDDNNVKYELIDIKENNPDEATIRKYYEKSGLALKKFFNTSGMIYRDLGLSKKLPDMTEEEQIKLLASDGMLVKRPLLVSGNLILTGFKEVEWAEKLLK
ncbi:MAG: arsenate reductase family protein [Eubacterium sp.]|nr:arsenate reductase family protein [Eubacterium sp.]MCR5628703.1 arsenate reductase family protein [Eubacterium sp.]